MKPFAPLIVSLTFLFSCIEPYEGSIQKSAIVSFIDINADTSDIRVKRDFMFDTHLDGNFYFTENFFYDDNLNFNYIDAVYEAKYEGWGIFECRVFDEKMWTLFCDTTKFSGSGVWSKIGKMPARKELIFQFINSDFNQGYRIRLTQFPQIIEPVDPPRYLSSREENIVQFNRNPGNDSILFSLVVIPKENFNQRTHPVLFFQHNFPLVPENDRFIVPGENLLKLEITKADSVFLNIVAIKREFKLVDNKRIGITYYVNNPVPVQFVD